ncbi:MAG: hypothetical protein KJZ83_17370 [Burkholderiaceae bacterium]|nr:hypothetical protein [Burkholderiaceae bacterium]
MRWWSRWFKAATTPNWLVLDDFFPNLLTGFRVAEYNALLDRFRGLRIASSYGDFDRAHAGYAALYPRFAPRVVRFDPEMLAGCRFAYLNFLNNAAQFLPWLEQHRVAFAMTLYPGGGFGLREAGSDRKLDRVLRSPLLRGLVVTQSASCDYVGPRLRAGVPVREIFGVVANPLYFEPAPRRSWFGLGKAEFDIAFVAEKYMERGANKGFPAFVEGVERWLRTLQPQLAALSRVHVVGGFGAHDWRECLPADLPGPDPAAAGANAAAPRFHGSLETHALRELLSRVDLVVSPNLPFVLHEGNFDGFPTGCCVEASLCGAAFAASDVLGLGAGRYRPGADFIAIDPDASGVASELSFAIAEPPRLRRIGAAGSETTRRLFDPAIQIGARIDFLGQLLDQAALEQPS